MKNDYTKESGQSSNAEEVKECLEEVDVVQTDEGWVIEDEYLDLLNIVRLPRIKSTSKVTPCALNSLTSLEGSPGEVGSEFNCSYTELTSPSMHPKKRVGIFIAMLTTLYLESMRQLQRVASMNKCIKGDYVLATKYDDGDPNDQWCVGVYDREEGGRHYVLNSEGFQFRRGGLRRVAKISQERGQFILDNIMNIPVSSHSLWWWKRCSIVESSKEAKRMKTDYTDKYGQSPDSDKVKLRLEAAQAIWTEDGWVVPQRLGLRSLYLTSLPLIKSVAGDFDCSLNDLTSLKGSPQKVPGAFGCSVNKLTSLAGSPGYVGGTFYCQHNNLVSLAGAPTFVGGDFYCYDNRLRSLKGAPRELKRGTFVCEDNRLTTLKYAPQILGGGLNCRSNRLKSFKGSPREIGGNFDCRNNPLVSCKGIPRSVDGDFKFAYKGLLSASDLPVIVRGTLVCTCSIKDYQLDALVFTCLREEHNVESKVAKETLV